MKTSPLKVENTAFLIEKLASDCAPLQYIRELTVNAIQAIQARRQQGWTGAGEIHWDVDWAVLASNPGIYRLQISDNGSGMSGPDIERYINSLSASGRVQGFDANYGLGAKITAGVLNPAGLIYRSWTGSRGAMGILHKDRDLDVYGLQQLSLPDGTFGHHGPITDETKPAPIDTNGTAVVLFGQTKSDITMKPPGQPLKWLIKYLNTRFFEIPDDITVKVRDFAKADPADWPDSPSVPMSMGGSQMRTVKGMRRHLEDHPKITSGCVELSTAIVHWYILPEESIQQSDIWETGPHSAAIFQGELYEMRAGRSAYGRLRDFGIMFGYDRVVLYVEPKTDRLSVTANTARSQLLVGGVGLPWDTWAAEFRQKIPQPIRDMMDEIAAAAGGRNHLDAIRRRLRDIRDLFRISRYRRTSAGGHLVGGNAVGGTARTFGGGGGGSGSSGGGGSGGGAGSIYGAYLDAGGDAAQKIAARLNEPEVKWVTVANGTRVADDELDDRAARYDERLNVVYANADFRVFTDFMADVCVRYSSAPPAAVKDAVEEWFSQQLIEAVLGVQSLKGSPAWETTTLEAALSPEALTTAVMPRYNTMRQITRSLGMRFGAGAAAEPATLAVV